MNLGYTILYVRSVTETVTFYEAAFGLEHSMIAPGDEYAEMKTGTTTLAFASTAFVGTHGTGPFQEAHPDQPAPPVELGFVTSEVAAAFDKAVAAGAVAVKSPERKPWGQLMGYVRDNNGFLVEICSPMNA